ncbi:MAG: YggT family protein [Gammaproteobacteria bacterium]|nr:YggT family protein [Gammaproteobacteria bacterium]
MDSNYLTNPAVFLIQALFGFYILLVVLRLLLQWLRADFYNPISQFIVKLTHPLLRPMRRFIPPLGPLDTSSLLLAWLLKSLEIGLLLTILGVSVSPLIALLWAMPALLQLTLNIFLFAIIIQAVLSWINPDPYSPIFGLLNSITRPVLEPFRRLLPDLGGIDLSPMVAIIALYLLEMLLLPPLKALLGMPLNF